ncbi:hypothetical protein SAMN02745753_01837 [Marinomonas polaris DSM 16579]|uniref:Uncharacterized protein n=1 Tax=Marinomonas polaris DSM 16579 TaxID=1122206 RepID=A0A1M5B628_9GAMM|nr:hypothetical protein [Marinomonas polaris]SHF37915.1 hypothetical protein SAMN02745753_01837 [Marinomonas polaris DSM 16579]
MGKLTLKTASANDLLRKCFEAGISYNLLLGTFDERDKKELNNFEDAIKHIHLFHRPQVYTLLSKAFRPRMQLEFIMAHLAELNCPMSLIGYLHCVAKNFPHLPFELLTNPKRSLLEPQNILKAYYSVREALDKSRQHNSEITITDPTLLTLYELVIKKKLTSSLVAIDERPLDNGETAFVIHSHGMFDAPRNDRNLDQFGHEHRHIIEVARELEIGNNPLDKVKFPLLNCNKPSKWASTLHALCCYYEGISPTIFCNKHLDIVPRNYHNTLREPNLIANQLKKFQQRSKALWQLLKPSSGFYPKIQQNTFDDGDPKLIKHMILRHLIMLYLTMLKHPSWSIKVRGCIETLQKLYSTDLLQKWDEHINLQRISTSSPCPLTDIQLLFQSNPVGLHPLWWLSGELPDPLELMGHYVNSSQLSNEQLTELNQRYRNTRLDIVALMIPRSLKIDTSQLFKKSITLQLGNPCKFYGPSNLQLEERLYLASLLVTGQYTLQTLKDNQKLESRYLENVLIGVCYLWHNVMIKKISQEDFLDLLVQHSLDDMSTATLRKRIKLAQEWLKKWPNVNLFNDL